MGTEVSQNDLKKANEPTGGGLRSAQGFNWKGYYDVEVFLT
jgi:hypothetical protein